MKFGLTSSEFDFIQQHVVAPLQAEGGKVFCYGSRARGEHHRFSDLDLMVEADADLARLVSQIQEHLTNSNFPYKVDLVEFRHFAEAYKPDYVRDRKAWA